MTAPPLPVPLARQAMDRFLAFHAVLMEVKGLAATMVSVEAPSEGGELPPAGPNAVDLFLRLQDAIFPNGGPPPAADGVVDMGYVMAALADEALLHQVEWPGRAQWMGTLLENALYGSRVAGEEIFDLGHAIAEGRIVGRADLAAAILLALSLGFRGRYNGMNDRGAIDELRRQLYEQVYNRPPPSGSLWQPALPAALQPVLEAEQLQRLPRIMPWVAAIVTAFLLFQAASHWIWYSASQPAWDLAHDVTALGSPPSPGNGQREAPP